jgi:hypothetical protein
VTLFGNVLIIIFMLSCAATPLGGYRDAKVSFSYVDEAGTFILNRETKLIDSKLVTRTQLLDEKGGGGRLLEKSVMLSRIGSIRNGSTRLLIVRPQASEYTVWIEGKKYVSRMQLVPGKRAMRVTLESPEAKWQGTSEVPVPKGKYLCFFGQLPECLARSNLIENARVLEGRRFNFVIVWDSFPYIQDLLTKTGQKLFERASIKFDGEINGLFRYIIEVDGQVISYQFTKTFELVKVAWVSQGITIAPPGQEIVEDE